MTTRIVLEVYCDDEPLATELRRITKLGEGSIEYLTILAALHSFEAARISRAIGRAEQYERTYAGRRGPRKKPVPADE